MSTKKIGSIGNEEGKERKEEGKEKREWEGGDWRWRKMGRGGGRRGGKMGRGGKRREELPVY